MNSGSLILGGTWLLCSAYFGHKTVVDQKESGQSQIESLWTIVFFYSQPFIWLQVFTHNIDLPLPEMAGLNVGCYLVVTWYKQRRLLIPSLQSTGRRQKKPLLTPQPAVNYEHLVMGGE